MSLNITEQLKREFPNSSLSVISSIIEDVERYVFEVINEGRAGCSLDNDLVLDELAKAFPAYKKQVLKAIVNESSVIGRGNLSIVIESLLKEEPKFELLKPGYIRDKFRFIEFTKTLKSIGIFDLDDFSKSSDLYDKAEGEANILNYATNYKNWIGNKLLLLKDTIKAKSIEELDREMYYYINLAIKHVNITLGLVDDDNLREKLKSEFFNTIHNINGDGAQTMFDLFKLFSDLENDRKTVLESEKYLKNPDNYDSYLNNIRLGQYEIQRVLALVSLYIDRERTLTYKHVKEEQDFLTLKIKDLVANPEEIISPKGKLDEPLYNFTSRKKIYWQTDVNGKYTFSNEAQDGVSYFEGESIQIKGKFRSYDKKENEVYVYHIASRMKKNPYSSVDKFIRKELSSFDEILDHKGFIFVVDSYTKDSKKLLKILENELGTLRTSWIEEPVHMKEGGNQNTSSEYDSIKGVLKINYGGKLIKDFFNLLGSFLNSSDFNRYKNLLDKLREKLSDGGCIIEDKDFSVLDEIVTKVNNVTLGEYYKDLRNKFGEKNYNIAVEIQIFDLENYVKAEIDPKSPAYHGHYKKEQALDNFTRLFPASVYGTDIISKVLEDELPKTNKYVDYKKEED